MEKKRINILYIEDDFMFASLIQRQIYTMGGFIQILYTTAFLKKYIRDSMIRIDVIIVDINGTSLMGLEHDLNGIDIPIVLTSSSKFLRPLDYKFVEKSQLPDFINEIAFEYER